jgi:hypothetical protein
MHPGPVVAVIVTSSVLEQAPLVMVHLNTAELPISKPVNPDVADEASVIIAVPEKTDHAPVPPVGVLPASVAVVAQAVRVWSAPALAAVSGVMVSVIGSLTAPHGPDGSSLRIVSTTEPALISAEEGV